MNQSMLLDEILWPVYVMIPNYISIVIFAFNSSTYAAGAVEVMHQLLLGYGLELLSSISALKIVSSGHVDLFRLNGIV